MGQPQLAGIARGKIIVGDASGNPALLSLGSNGYVLKSDGSDIAWAEDATVAALTSEQVQDIAGAMFSSNTETGIAATYQDGDGTIDLVIGANVIVSGMIAQNSILTRHIDDDQVTEAQLANSINADIATGVAALPKAGGAMTGNLAMAANNVNVNDNGKVQFGNSDDLQIYHDGSNSYIDEGGTGILYIRSNDVRLMKADGSETMLQADDDGAVNLFHNNAVKLQTEAGGVHITGYADADNFKIAGAQGTDGQLLTSTGSGVAWEDAPAGGPTFKTFGDSSFLVGNATTGTINGADYNTGVGVLALNGITTGDANTAIGRATLYLLTTGSSNTAVGMNAGANVTGSSNTAVGESALSSASGSSASNNTAVGKEALKVNTTGTGNTALGYLALTAKHHGS